MIKFVLSNKVDKVLALYSTLVYWINNMQTYYFKVGTTTTKLNNKHHSLQYQYRKAINFYKKYYFNSIRTTILNATFYVYSKNENKNVLNTLNKDTSY